MDKKNNILNKLQKIVGDSYVLFEKEDLITYEYDGSIDAALPLAVVLPKTNKQVAEIVKLANENKIPIIPRGAGTGLSGGAVAELGGIILTLTRMNDILNVDINNRVAIVEPGLINIELSKAISKDGLYYAPDPSSQKVCTIGGNVAENSGGPHCLAYGVTTNHILGMEIVTADGSITWIGSKNRESNGYDLRGIVIGSEGTLAIVTKIAVRLLKKPEYIKTFLAVFKNVEQASAAVSSIIGSGIIPAAIEMMDSLCIKAAEAAVPAGYSKDAGAILLIEADGLKEEVEEEIEEIEEICQDYSPLETREATDEKEREKLWEGRKGVLGALGRLAPNYYLVDGTVPRTKLVEVLSEIEIMSKKYNLPIANVLHAGDGNLHPSILFDQRNKQQTELALKIGGEILKLCVDVGGVLSGEHGIGIEKQEYLPLMFNNDDMEYMSLLKPAFQTNFIFNPGKIFPSGSKCADNFQFKAISKMGPSVYI